MVRNKSRIIFYFFLIITLLFVFNGCAKNNSGKMDPNRPLSGEEKRKKNLAEGRGASIGSIMNFLHHLTSS